MKKQQEKETKKKPGRKSKFKDDVKTAMIYNTEVPAVKLQDIKDFISFTCSPFLRS